MVTLSQNASSPPFHDYSTAIDWSTISGQTYKDNFHDFPIDVGLYGYDTHVYSGKNIHSIRIGFTRRFATDVQTSGHARLVKSVFSRPHPVTCGDAVPHSYLEDADKVDNASVSTHGA
ncbi:hypothetical protein TELCIR_10818 [Teladorsagia circumcincta]|uniref:Uncharacterized protein n=1 Tax=Teladorsagia circumcincta TaxID=45464 RepID=A0A2G9UB29_TELCI|nr:hypothetical protein TELCIR_10818 [Teladorsagia circumcincta]